MKEILSLHLLEQIHLAVWGPWTLVIFLGTGLFFTLKSRFFQFRRLPLWWRATAGSIGSTSADQLRSVCTSLAATIGTGNIAGVATALTAGGPGALFWMWVSAFIGMATAYAETWLGIRFRGSKADGRSLCGPFLYLEQGLELKGLGMIYAFLCLLCSFGMGSMVQSNSAVTAISSTWHISGLLPGLIFTVLVAAVILGGIRRIGSVTEKLVPLASLLYLLFSLTVIFSCYDRLPAVFSEIFAAAFRPEAAVGGAAGYGVSRSLRYGISRGVFSNEAGLGTLAILHGSADTEDAASQGMWAIFEVFFDTVILCTLTALVILCVTGPAPEKAGYKGAALASWCFGSRLGPIGEYVISLSMAVFAYATIIAWFYIGGQAADYLVNNGISSLLSRRLYPALFLLAVFAGSQARLQAVWLFSDIVNGLMAFPNLMALIFLSGMVEWPGSSSNIHRT